MATPAVAEESVSIGQGEYVCRDLKEAQTLYRMRLLDALAAGGVRARTIDNPRELDMRIAEDKCHYVGEGKFTVVKSDNEGWICVKDPKEDECLWIRPLKNSLRA